MKWFKHLVESGNDPDIGAIMDEFGFQGYYLFFRTLEILGRECDPHNPGELNCNFSWLKSQFFCGISKKKLKSFYDFCSKLNKGKGRFVYEMNGRDINLKCMKFKELVDEYTRQKPYRDNKKVTGKVTKKVTPKNKEYKNKDNKDKSRLKNQYEQKHFKLAVLLKRIVKHNRPMQKIESHHVENWANDIRLMDEQDEISLREIESVIEHLKHNDFWGANIGSGSKLREKFATIHAQMNRKGNHYQVDQAGKSRDKKIIPASLWDKTTDILGDPQAIEDFFVKRESVLNDPQNIADWQSIENKTPDTLIAFIERRAEGR
jgi:hypothetical protein